MSKSAESKTWLGKPLLLDHEVKDVSSRCVGIINDAKYGIDKTKKGNLVEGLWLSGFGLVDEGMYQRLIGTDIIPPIIKNVSIGGEGEGEPGVNPETGKRVTRIIRLNPQELSVVSIPGIPEAHFADIKRITESYIAKDIEIVVQNKDVSLYYAIERIKSMTNQPIKIKDIKEHDMGVNDPDKIPIGTVGDSKTVSQAGKRFGTIFHKFPDRRNQEAISKRDNKPFVSEEKLYSVPTGYSLEGGRVYKERKAPDYKVSPYFRKYEAPKSKVYNMFTKRYTEQSSTAYEQMPTMAGNVGAGNTANAVKIPVNKLVNEEPISVMKQSTDKLINEPIRGPKYNKPSVMTPYKDMMGTGTAGVALPQSIGKKPAIQPLVKDEVRYSNEEEELLDMVFSAEDSELENIELYVMGEMSSRLFSGPQLPIIEVAKKKWIPKDLKKGALRATAKSAGVIKGDEKIPKSWLQAKAKMGGKIGHRARLAISFSKMKH